MVSDVAAGKECPAEFDVSEEGGLATRLPTMVRLNQDEPWSLPAIGPGCVKTCPAPLLCCRWVS